MDQKGFVERIRSFYELRQEEFIGPVLGNVGGVRAGTLRHLLASDGGPARFFEADASKLPAGIDALRVWIDEACKLPAGTESGATTLGETAVVDDLMSALYVDEIIESVVHPMYFLYGADWALFAIDHPDATSEQSEANELKLADGVVKQIMGPLGRFLNESKPSPATRLRLLGLLTNEYGGHAPLLAWKTLAQAKITLYAAAESSSAGTPKSRYDAPAPGNIEKSAPGVVGMPPSLKNGVHRAVFGNTVWLAAVAAISGFLAWYGTYGGGAERSPSGVFNAIAIATSGACICGIGITPIRYRNRLRVARELFRSGSLMKARTESIKRSSTSKGHGYRIQFVLRDPSGTLYRGVALFDNELLGSDEAIEILMVPGDPHMVAVFHPRVETCSFTRMDRAV